MPNSTTEPHAEPPRPRRAGWRSTEVVLAMLLAVALTVLLIQTTRSGGGTSGMDHSGSSDSAAMPAGGKTRTYYIAANPVDWDYAPAQKDLAMGASDPDAPGGNGDFSKEAKVYTQHSKNRVGTVYRKCLYQGYTDKTFATQQPRPASQAYMGDLGPTIHAEVGDTIKVVYRNNCDFPTTIHPHGVFYTKANEGAPYNDGTGVRDGDDVGKGPLPEQRDDAVQPHHSYTYTWQVPERAGPGPADGSSVAWMYHSHNDEIRDVYSGLTGFIVITAKGKAKADGSPSDVDQEVFSLFEIDNENESRYANYNRRKLADPPKATDPGYVESNLMHTINGYIYGNGPTIMLKRGQHVRWYLMGMGSESDMHTPHWHGNTVTVMGMRTDVTTLMPASMATADMTPDNPGMWLFHCHVNDHIEAGMTARYWVAN